ncbi:hypothetical protein G4Z16_06565 [Streptomyces bathyalis]|uniref:DUF6895 domain-containing protein n=1 Tax=Streptomyces bathyalis TaxID=2710756 RepID=A0A7T1WQ17_9ACTN|nr:hypothetical protein [Streptomyces bathyalis]QPP06113.1 hypothetical protein G4Z16_06565 [Streptomyces bathyalis]
MSPAADAPSWPALPAHAGTEDHALAAAPLTEEEAAGRVLSGALRWTEANLEWFAPQRWQEYLPPRPFGPGPLLELLGLIRVLERSGLMPPDAPLRIRALDLAEEATHTDDFARGMNRVDELFPYHLNLIGLMECLGRPQRELRTRCEALLAAGSGGHALPYKPVLNRIELRYFIDRGGFTAPAALPGLGTLHRQSIAALGPDVLHLTESEIYAFTHVLFYVTDFGRRRDLLGGPEELAGLRETVRVLLGVQLARGSLDLLAELLLCVSALSSDGEGVQHSGPGRGRSDGSEFLVSAGWNALARAARADGSVPSPVHRPDILDGLTGDKAAAYVFGTCYHTTLAAALAAGAAPAAVPKGSRADGAGNSCAPPTPMPRAGPEEIRRWARAAASRTSGPAREGEHGACRGHLGPLLVLAVQARDPDVLADVLLAAERLGLGGDSLVRSAQALLTAWSR